MRIIAIGRLRNGPEAELFARYAGRMKPRLELTEVPEAKGAPSEVKRREGAALLAALPEQALIMALDLGGMQPDTAGLATLVERWVGTSRPVCFLIGGAEGLDSAVIQRADHVLSLGALTWPHFLVRAMLAEQLYRCWSMSIGAPVSPGWAAVGAEQ